MQDKILAQRTVFDHAIDLLIDAKLNRWVQYAGGDRIKWELSNSCHACAEIKSQNFQTFD